MLSRVNSLFQRHVIGPILNLLRVGACPRRLAWSLAIGIAVGINPLLGTTTVASLGVAFCLRLNLVASQITTHLVYPLQFAFFFLFLRIGDVVFHTGPLPLTRSQLFHAARHHPIQLTRTLWPWEWHALIIWLVIVPLVTPILVAGLTPLLERLLVTLHRDQPALAQ